MKQQLIDWLRRPENANKSVEQIVQHIESIDPWISVDDGLPPDGAEVIFFNKEWINEDFNPNGTRIGFLNDNDFVSAHYWNYHDCYMTISHEECDGNDIYSDKIRGNIKPTHWQPLPEKPKQ